MGRIASALIALLLLVATATSGIAERCFMRCDHCPAAASQCSISGVDDCARMAPASPTLANGLTAQAFVAPGPAGVVALVVPRSPIRHFDRVLFTPRAVDSPPGGLALRI